ncbi:MAG: nitrous oxide-stimulated promoter family protein [Chitinivibrionales bacterium]|nr:nitrous oxide-stimulated promoter family protein [Chitinivibrionales bacterium]MBD3394369.1 nitrous oxide-stimulated promoter family protein [Chitinivibrionales bacterium]
MTRIEQEKETVAAMLGLYCAGRHGSKDGLCPGCAALLAYSHAQLAHCRFGEKKTTCRICPVHCYRGDMRARIRAVMRYAGPRMPFRHPLLTWRHILNRLGQRRKSRGAST